MQVLSDGGGIYTLGRQPGTILSNNHIHDIPLNLGKAQSNGIFMDQGSSEITVIENKIHKIAKSPIRFHKAKENFITKNTFRLPKGLDTYTFNSTDKTLIIFTENQVYLD
jgi:hypothetical protein